MIICVCRYVYVCGVMCMLVCVYDYIVMLHTCVVVNAGVHLCWHVCV